MRAMPYGVLALFASCLAACVADDRPAEWSVISTTIFQPSCGTAGCHSQLAQTSGIILDTSTDGYRTLVTHPPDGYGAFVIAGDPDHSALVYLLRGQEVKRMPPDGPLPQADIELVERWIAAGAKP